MIDRWLPSRACPYLAALLILAAACWRVVFLLGGSLDLAPDEAHYWDWSRNLDWSYYSKGPLVAWIIRLSCEWLGPYSEATTGNLTFAVRAPAVLFGSLVLAALYVLTVQVSRNAQLALAVVAAALTHPLISAGSSLMTIDAPYTCLWAWALVVGLHAVRTDALWAWLITGLLVGLGILAKYTMVLFLPSVLLFLLWTSDGRRRLSTLGPWAMIGIASLSCVPILVWNAQHDWVTVRHVLALAGLGPAGPPRAPGGLKLLGPIHYLAGQFALLLGTWFVLWALALVTYAPWRDDDTGRRFLWFLSVPMFTLFLVFSVKTGGGELNWPVTTYLSGSVLAAIWLSRHLLTPEGRPRLGLLAAVAAACGIGLIGSTLLYVAPLLHPFLEPIVGPPTAQYRFPLRRIDPTCRLRGWRQLAEVVDAFRQRARAAGEEPVIVATGWALPGELGIYCEGKPRVYSIGQLQGERYSQYDLWINPVDAPEAFRGRTFLIVGHTHVETLQAFARVEPPHRVVVEVGGRPIADFHVQMCHGFQGFGARPKSLRH